MPRCDQRVHGEFERQPEALDGDERPERDVMGDSCADRAERRESARRRTRRGRETRTAAECDPSPAESRFSLPPTSAPSTPPWRCPSSHRPGVRPIGMHRRAARRRCGPYECSREQKREQHEHRDDRLAQSIRRHDASSLAGTRGAVLYPFQAGSFCECDTVLPSILVMDRERGQHPAVQALRAYGRLVVADDATTCWRWRLVRCQT